MDLIDEPGLQVVTTALADLITQWDAGCPGGLTALDAAFGRARAALDAVGERITG